MYKPSSLVAVQAAARAAAPYTRLLPMDVVDHMRAEMRIVLTAHWLGMELVNRVTAELGARETGRAPRRRGGRERGEEIPTAPGMVLHRLNKPLNVLHTLLEALSTDEEICMPSGEAIRQLNRLCDSMAAAMLLGFVNEYLRGQMEWERDDIDERLLEAVGPASEVLYQATKRLPFQERNLLQTLRSYRWNIRRTGRVLVMREDAVSALCSTMLLKLGAALREELGAPP